MQTPARAFQASACPAAELLQLGLINVGGEKEPQLRAVVH
eukprot:COSAG04_NODE_57_length_30587_cov_86.784632_13_plen_40_part_00